MRRQLSDCLLDASKHHTGGVDQIGRQRSSPGCSFAIAQPRIKVLPFDHNCNGCRIGSTCDRTYEVAENSFYYDCASLGHALLLMRRKKRYQMQRGEATGELNLKWVRQILGGAQDREGFGNRHA